MVNINELVKNKDGSKMKKILLLLLGLTSIIYSQTEKKFPLLKGDYLGQPLPGDIPVVFAPGIISVDSTIEHGSPSFSPDGKYLFFTRGVFPGNEDVMWVSAKIIDRIRKKIMR